MAQTRRERIISEDAATQAKQLKSEHEQEKVALQSQAESAQNLQQKTAQELQALKERDAPRKLTEEQGRKISLELRRSGKTFAVIVRNSPSDLESQDYAGQIASAITAAGWTITPPPFRIITRDATGLFITIKDVTKPAPEGAVLLQKALTSAGIDSSGVSDETMPDGAFELYVGQKPRANKPK